ncbi:hypothetical protein PXNS11_190010 [Stutzerimonas xanthomarina]|nr:hypothetical protein PXNS11_190010 [Stutzerimonas xanthomarina]
MLVLRRRNFEIAHSRARLSKICAQTTGSSESFAGKVSNFSSRMASWAGVLDSLPAEEDKIQTGAKYLGLDV